jgi:hypothetical protein
MVKSQNITQNKILMFLFYILEMAIKKKVLCVGRLKIKGTCRASGAALGLGETHIKFYSFRLL